MKDGQFYDKHFKFFRFPQGIEVPMHSLRRDDLFTVKNRMGYKSGPFVVTHEILTDFAGTYVTARATAVSGT